jgi:transcriptional regulator with XRE-family HTH domain
MDMAKIAHTLGIKIKSLRRQKEMTLSQLSILCKCSPSLLSQIERGTVNPSFSTLKAIGDALGTTVAHLVAEISPTGHSPSSLMRPKERKSLTTEGGVRFQLLTRNLSVPFEFILNQWPPGTSTGKKSYAHEGEEAGLLLEGELEVEVEGKVSLMKAGDTITLRSSAIHRISNPGKKRALAVWVNSVPWVFSTK